jgi:type IV pilus assembly protein PilE
MNELSSLGGSVLKSDHRAPSPRGVANAQRGFTLIELMIVVAIVGILAAIALPSYLDYLRRGKLVDGTTTLSALRAKMEQYYLDNRKYNGDGSPCKGPIDDVGDFSFSCEYDKKSYTITATGSGSVADFAYTIGQEGVPATTALPTTWGTPMEGCWIIRPGGTC